MAHHFNQWVLACALPPQEQHGPLYQVTTTPTETSQLVLCHFYVCMFTGIGTMKRWIHKDSMHYGRSVRACKWSAPKIREYIGGRNGSVHSVICTQRPTNNYHN